MPQRKGPASIRGQNVPREASTWAHDLCLHTGPCAQKHSRAWFNTVAIFSILIIFEQETPHFHLEPGPANYVASHEQRQTLFTANIVYLPSWFSPQLPTSHSSEGFQVLVKLWTVVRELVPSTLSLGVSETSLKRGRKEGGIGSKRLRGCYTHMERGFPSRDTAVAIQPLPPRA